jgi:hypothetical protein
MTPLAALVDEPVLEAAARQQLGEDGTAGARSRRTRERWAASGLVVAVAVAAFAVRMWIALRGGGIGGTYGYDDGVYYAASASFVWGRLPYRDFVLLHPPGVMLALTPFALLGRITRDHVGFETARVAWMLVGALNASLVFRICRRDGLVAATAGGLFYAVWTPVALTETNTRLEPLVSLGLLVAVTLLSRRPGPPSRRVLLWAGAALALAVSVKIWAVVPGALVLLWVWRRAGTKAAGWTVLGGLTAGMLVDGPFLLAAPTQMFRMVVRDQLARGRTPMDTAARLAHVLVPGIAPPYQWSPGPATLVMGGCVLAVVGLACLGSGSGRFAVSLLGVQVLVLVLSPSFFSYYNAFAVPGLALVVAQVVRWTLALSGAGPTFRAWGGSRPRVMTAVVLAMGPVLALSASLGVDSRVVTSAPFPGAGLARVAAAARCATSDSPDALLLTDLYTRDLQRGCQVPVDLSGLTYDRDAVPHRPDGTPVPRSRNARWQHDLGSYLFSGQSIFVLRPRGDGGYGSAVRRLRSLPALDVGSAYALLRNDSSQRAGARDFD